MGKEKYVLKSIILTYSRGETERIMLLEGEQAEKWDAHNHFLNGFAHLHGKNPFDDDPVFWTIKEK